MTYIISSSYFSNKRLSRARRTSLSRRKMRSSFTSRNAEPLVSRAPPPPAKPRPQPSGGARLHLSSLKPYILML